MASPVVKTHIIYYLSKLDAIAVDFVWFLHCSFSSSSSIDGFMLVDLLITQPRRLVWVGLFCICFVQVFIDWLQLTKQWKWCSKTEKKETYYYVMRKALTWIQFSHDSGKFLLADPESIPFDFGVWKFSRCFDWLRWILEIKPKIDYRAEFPN